MGHVGEDLHRRLRIAAQHVDRDVGCVPICAGGQGAAEESDVFGQANGVAGAGAFIEQLGGDRRQPGQLRCVVIRARSNQCARGDQRCIVALRHQNPQSVLQRLPPYLRKTVGVRAAGRRGLCAVYNWAHSGFNDERGMQNLVVTETQRVETVGDPAQTFTRRMRIRRMRVRSTNDFGKQPERGVIKPILFQDGIE